VLKKVSMGHQNILTLVDYFETMNNRMCFFAPRFGVGVFLPYGVHPRLLIISIYMLIIVAP
jgi:hypothetical protein